MFVLNYINDSTCLFSITAMVQHVCSQLQQWFNMFVLNYSNGSTCLFSITAMVQHVCSLLQQWFNMFVLYYSNGSTCLFSITAMVQHACSLLQQWFTMFVLCYSNGSTCLFSVTAMIQHVLYYSNGSTCLHRSDSMWTRRFSVTRLMAWPRVARWWETLLTSPKCSGAVATESMLYLSCLLLIYNALNQLIIVDVGNMVSRNSLVAQRFYISI